jgi:hypothetical protein
MSLKHRKRYVVSAIGLHRVRPPAGVLPQAAQLIGNGYLPGHAELALDLIHTNLGVRALFDAGLGAD